MKIKCPKCSSLAVSDDINMNTDLAYCRTCENAFSISDQIKISDVSAETLASPPKGSWMKQDKSEHIIGATTRSPMAFFLVPFMIIWSGFSLGGIYGRQIASGEFNLTESLFGIPFLIGSIIFWSLAIMSICGKVEVTCKNGRGRIFVGVSKLGWNRKFNLNELKEIREESSQVNYPGGRGSVIVLEGKNRIKFGSNLNEDRRYFMLNAIRYLKLTES